MPRAHIGSKIRERRKALGQTQAALAKQVGISASYLNLIEANKRQIGGHLLQKTATALDLELDSLDGAVERRLAEHLHELTAEPILKNLELDPAGAFDFIGRYPKWARALVTTHRALKDQTELAAALSDRLNHDPFLSDAVHNMLTNVTAIRSASEILETVSDLDAGQRARFDKIIGNESQRLSDVAAKLAAYFDKAGAEMRSLTPAEEVDDFLWEHGNYFPGLEAAAESLLTGQFEGQPASEADLILALARRHGIEIEDRAEADLTDLMLRNGCHDDQANNRLIFSDTVPVTTKRFQIARSLAERSLGDAIKAELEEEQRLTSKAAYNRASRALSSYAAGAMLMPYTSFLKDTLGLRYDVERLAHRYQVSFEQACHRLVTLKRPDATGIPFAFIRADAAGFVTKRFPLQRLPLPRLGHACPLWAVYTAFQSPGMIMRQLAELPSGDRFLFFARSASKEQATFQTHRPLVSIMLACDSIYADQTIYGDGLNVSAPSFVTPIGPTCRLCSRETCRYREEDPIIGV